MTGTEFYFAAATGVAVALLANIAGSLRAIRARVVPPLSEPAPTLPSDPKPGAHSFAGAISTGEHAGRRYTLHGDGAVIAPFGSGVATWRTEDEFRAWAERQPAPSDNHA